jgi:peptidoglycan/xylan/chitin deacetylase (PgdA/CDA1 family)
MFSENYISPINFSISSNFIFPPKTLCLTFDDGPGETIGDGPGPKTLKLAKFLNKNGIRATFFR